MTAFCFYRAEGVASREAAERAAHALSTFGRIEAFPIPQEHSTLRLGWDHLRSLISGRTYTRFVYQSAKYRARLVAELREQSYDLVHADSLDLSGYFDLLDGLPVVCVHHDIQSSLLARRARHEANSWRRRYVAHQAKLMAAEERMWCPRVALNVTVSDVDRTRLAELVPAARTLTVPNGVDTDYFRPEPGRELGIISVGGTGWFPNLDGLQFFCEEILPHLRAAGDRSPVTWVGRATDAERQMFDSRYGVVLTGYVDDVRPYVRDAACYVVPLRVGGGTRVKILDAWAMGKAVVSTSIGCEGLDAVDGENILVRDSPAEFAAAVYEVLTDPALRARLGAAARRTVERTYSWDVIGQTMIAEYLELCNRTANPLASGEAP